MEYVWMQHPSVGTPVEVPATSVAYYQSKGWYTVAGPGNRPTPDVPVFVSPDAPAEVLTVAGVQFQPTVGGGLIIHTRDGDGGNANLDVGGAADRAEAAAVALQGTVDTVETGRLSAVELSAAFAGKPTTDLGDWALLRRDTSDAIKGVSWSTTEAVIARALGWFVVTDAEWAGGAKRDGTDSAPAINAAVTAAKGTARLGRTVYIPDGTFTCLTKLDLTGLNGITIKGASRYGTKVVNNTTDLADVSGSSNIIECLTLESNGNNGHIFNQVGSWFMNTIRDFAFYKLGESKSVWYAVASASGDYIDNVVENGEFYHSYTATVAGWYYLRDSSTYSCNHNTWRNFRWTRSGNYAFHLEATVNRLYDNTFEDINFEVCTGGVMKLLTVTGTVVKGAVVYDLAARGPAERDLFVIGKSTGANSSHNRLSGIYRRGGALGSGIVDIRFHVASGLHTQLDSIGSASAADVFTADLGSGSITVRDASFVTFQNDAFATKIIDGLVSAQGYADKLATKTANYTATVYDSVLIANGAAVTITLPSAVTGGAGRKYTVKNRNAAAATVGSTAGTIDGAATDTLVQWETATYISDGTNWYVI